VSVSAIYLTGASVQIIQVLSRL